MFAPDAWRALAPAMVLALAGVTACLDDPKLKGCAEFATDEQVEVCGSACERYCALMVDHCPGEALGATVAACESNCLEQLAGGGALGDESGDTVQCRITHALRARSDASECAAASKEGGGVCVNQLCPEYCDLMDQRCAGAYVSRDACLKTCAMFDEGNDDSPGHTLRCRLAAARDASGPEDEACRHASMNGGNRCGEPCAAYCQFVGLNCKDDNALYPSTEACLRTCRLLDQEGSIVDWQTDADTVQCRTYHASSPASVSPETHCPHASFYNGAHCGLEVCGTFCDFAERSCPGTFDGDPDACRAACEGVAEPKTLLPLGDAGGECRDAEENPISL